ncbi:pentatricopeptide repeat-containing protein At3g48250, chloroplastic-like [Papaver somniferum]|nr:pentatricopeptide repeat-containing protein At3g48250, chloroplastic-like [Papaver somniferum]
MKRAKGIIASLRQINSVLLSHSSTVRSPHFQVTQFSHFSQNVSSSLFRKPNFSSINYVDHKIKYFSSKPNLTVDLVMNNDWSDELEHELRKSKPTNKSVLYVLRKLSKNHPIKAYNFFKWAYDNNDSITPNSSVYTLMLRVLGQKEFIKEFLVVIKKMTDEGCELEEAAYVKILGNLRKEKLSGVADALVDFFEERVKQSAVDAIVKSAIGVIRELDWSDEVIGKLEDMNLLLNEDTVLHILRGLRGCPLKGLQFFYWVADKRGFRHNAVTYNAVLKVLGHEDSIEKFWDVMKEMKNVGHAIEFDTYVKLARQFHKAKLMKDAVELYELMMDGPHKPSVQDFRTLLRQISLHPDPEISLVFRVVKKHESIGHSLSKADYDGIHRCLMSAGKFDEAEDIMETMKNAGYEPDNITYSQVVYGLSKAGRLEEARQMLDEMESKGCTPDLKTWTILIQGLCVAGDVYKALTCYTDMVRKNCQFDADLLAVLVTGLCKIKEVSTAYTLAVEMIEQGHLRPWQATYKFLIQDLLAERKFEESIKLLYSMTEHNYPPFQDPFLQYVSKFGSVDDAREYLKALTVKEYPSNSAYVNLFQAFFNEGRIFEARDLLYICPQHIRNHKDIVNKWDKPKPVIVSA